MLPLLWQPPGPPALSPSHAGSPECPLSGKGDRLQELKCSGVWDQTCARVQGMEPCVWRVGYCTLGLLALAVGWGEQLNPNFGVEGTSQNLWAISVM